jgi:hypothetical protein
MSDRGAKRRTTLVGVRLSIRLITASPMTASQALEGLPVSKHGDLGFAKAISLSMKDANALALRWIEGRQP